MLKTQSLLIALLGSTLSAAVPVVAQTVTPAPTPPTTPDEQKLIDQDHQDNIPRITSPKQNPKKPYQPVCSTEKVNGNCYININRFYPYNYPNLMMKPGASVTVNVFNPFSFEKLTLETSAPSVVNESFDQFGALVTAITPGLKGTSIDGTTFIEDSGKFSAAIKGNFDIFDSAIKPPDQSTADLEAKIKNAEIDLNNALESVVSTYISPYTRYATQTNEIYRQIRLISLQVPRPANDPDQTPPLREELFEAQQKDGCFDIKDPWHSYNAWRQCMLKDLTYQGNSGIALWSLFPNKCQKQNVPSSLWTAPTPQCATDATGRDLGDSVEPAQGPHIDPSLWQNYANLTKDLDTLKNVPGGSANYQNLEEAAQKIDQRANEIASFLSGVVGSVPATLTKQSTDMQNFYIALLNAPARMENPEIPESRGALYGPEALKPSYKVRQKYLGIPLGTAPSITFNVNEQNLAINTLLSAPTTTQRVLVASIPLTFAAPRFETSSGVFLSMLNNRSFANTTDVSITTSGTTQTPTPTDVKISETLTNKPLFIPYYAAHYRISPEWTWLGGRRGAFYATGALGVNPYLTDLEYAAGFGISWRYLMFSPVYHLGRSTHLTQGEQVGQIWCVYGGTATATTNPPSCSGAPPAPTTKNFLTGAFAIGIGVRIPTTFVSTNK